MGNSLLNLLSFERASLVQCACQIYFLMVLCNYCTSANNFYGSSKDKISLKF